MSQFNDIHRHADGSADIAFYRAKATAMRRRAMRDGATLKAALRCKLVHVALLGAVTLLAAASGRDSQNNVNAPATATAQPIYCSYPGASGAPSMPCWLARPAPATKLAQARTATE